MGRLIQITLDRLPIGSHCLQQCGGGRSRRREQCFDKAPGLVGIQMDLIALLDNLARCFTTVRNDKRGHRATLKRGRFLEKLSVHFRHACDKSPFLWFSYNRLHASNVRLCGTQCKG